jgi:Spy/CpxP family protein refolding chaperone
MPRWRALILCVVLLVSVPTLAGAQSFKWWQQDRTKAELGLTPEQSVKLEGVFQDLYPRLNGAKESLDRLEKRLSGLIAPGTASEAEVMKLVYEVEDARAALNRTRTLMVYRMHLLLTPEQRLTMKAMHDRWEQERRKTGRQSTR